MTQIFEIVVHSVLLGQGRGLQREANKMGKESKGFHAAQQGQHRLGLDRRGRDFWVSPAPTAGNLNLFLHINTEGVSWIYQWHFLSSEEDGMEQVVATSSSSSDETVPGLRAPCLSCSSENPTLSTNGILEPGHHRTIFYRCLRTWIMCQVLCRYWEESKR